MEILSIRMCAGPCQRLQPRSRTIPQADIRLAIPICTIRSTVSPGNVRVFNALHVGVASRVRLLGYDFSFNLWHCAQYVHTSELSDYATGLEKLVTNYSFDTTGPIDEDVAIYGRIVKYALANVSAMSSSQIEALCEAAASALHEAASRDAQLAVSYLSEPWTSQLALSTVDEDGDSPICSTMLEHSPRSFLRLLRTLPLSDRYNRRDITRSLTVTLLTLHRVEVDAAPDPPAALPYDAFTQSAMLVKEWPSDLSSCSQAWHHLFIWAGGGFITEATSIHGLTLAPQATAELTNVVSGALDRMAEALRTVIQRGWYNCGYDGAVFPWPACMFSVASDAPTNGQRGAADPAAITLLHRLAPESLKALLDVLELAVESRQLGSPHIVDYDIRFARLYAVASPQKQERVLLCRRSLGYRGGEGSSHRCSYHLP